MNECDYSTPIRNKLAGHRSAWPAKVDPFRDMVRLTLSAPIAKLMGNHSGSLRLVLKQSFCTLLAGRISDRGQCKLKNANIKMEIVRIGERKKLMVGLLGYPAACRGYIADLPAQAGGVSPVESQSITPQGGRSGSSSVWSTTGFKTCGRYNLNLQ